MALRDNTVRGMILALLRKTYPQGMDGMTVCGILNQQAKPSQILDCLEYMADKNYVEKRTIPHPYIKQENIDMYRISALGIDLYDGIATDAGIVVIPDNEG